MKEIFICNLLITLTVAIFFQKRSSVIEKNRSTELATILLSDNDQNAVDKGHILAELYARFNELSHSALLGKLKSFEITSDSHNWFTGYLFSRK